MKRGLFLALLPLHVSRMPQDKAAALKIHLLGIISLPRILSSTHLNLQNSCQLPHPSELYKVRALVGVRKACWGLLSRLGVPGGLSSVLRCQGHWHQGSSPEAWCLLIQGSPFLWANELSVLH